MMVLFGVYGIIMGAISQLNIPVLIPVAIGVLIGLLLGAKLIDILLERFPQATFWAILGLIVGSLFSVYSAAGFASVSYTHLTKALTANFAVFRGTVSALAAITPCTESSPTNIVIRSPKTVITTFLTVFEIPSMLISREALPVRQRAR